MVKADAYNHGMLLSIFIEDLVDCYGVSTTKEGIYLRELGIEKKIKVACFVAEDAQDIATFELIPVISNFYTLNSLIGLNKKVSVDIKINSGMNRLGFSNEEEIICICNILKKNHNININSISTHFAYNSYKEIKKQAKEFDRKTKIIEDRLGKQHKNAAASGAILYDEFLYDEVRLGLLLYGYQPNKNNKDIFLRKAMSVTTKLIEIKEVKKGDRIGYSGLYKTDKNVKIGIIQCGYFDGIKRNVSGYEVEINGEKTRIIGNICMDLATVLLDNIDAKIGDDVILLDEKNNANIYSEVTNTIAYETLTSFKGRFQRIFYL